MRARRLQSRPRIMRTHSPPPNRTHTPNWTSPEYKNIGHALQTLDNQHSLLLLQNIPALQPPLLCLSTNYSHHLARHDTCLSSTRNCLSSRPTCLHCLPVYLAHSNFADQPDLDIRSKVSQALKNSQDAELLQYLPQLESCPYMRLLSSMSIAGAEVEKVQIVEEESQSRKVMAREHIDKDEVILFMPKSRLITLELAQQLPTVRKLLQQRVLLKSPKHSQLALFLLQHFQMGSRSPFVHYLSTLPMDFSRFPVNYPPHLLEELKATSILQQISNRRQDIARDYQILLAIQPQLNRFGLQKFIEARLLVSSRVFGIIVEGVKTDALVPVADMLNHHLPKQTSWFYCDKRKGFVIQSLREIEAGMEIFDSYGQKCNSRFLLNYGFTLASNSHNQVSLQIILPHIVNEQHQPTTAKIRISRLIESKGFQQMMSLLRVSALRKVATQENEEQPRIIETLPADALKHTTFQSFTNEIQAWRLLQNILNEQLHQYPTDIGQDRKILSRQLDPDVLNIVRLRMGEKEVLMFYQCMARRVLRWLGNSGRGELKSYESYALSLPL